MKYACSVCNKRHGANIAFLTTNQLLRIWPYFTVFPKIALPPRSPLSLCDFMTPQSSILVSTDEVASCQELQASVKR